jgi:hypothetical protein
MLLYSAIGRATHSIRLSFAGDEPSPLLKGALAPESIAENLNADESSEDQSPAHAQLMQDGDTEKQEQQAR